LGGGKGGGRRQPRGVKKRSGRGKKNENRLENPGRLIFFSRTRRNRRERAPRETGSLVVIVMSPLSDPEVRSRPSVGDRVGKTGLDKLGGLQIRKVKREDPFLQTP